MKLLDLIKLFLRLAVDDPDDKPADPPVDADAPDPAADLEVELDDEPPPADADKSPEADAALAEIRAEKARGDRLERELAELKTARPHDQPRDRQFEEEEQLLRDEKTDPLRKWQIQADRELRRGRSEAQFALAQAQDIADRTQFSQIALTNAPLYKRYASKVEEELVKIRATGRNATREALLDWMVGRDMRNGVFTKKKAAAPKEGETAAPAVNRGKLPGARSDVSGRAGSMTNKQKLEKKLDGVQI